MPEFEITDPRSGETLTIEANREPSQSEVADIFAKHGKPKAKDDLVGWSPSFGPMPKSVREAFPKDPFESMVQIPRAVMPPATGDVTLSTPEGVPMRLPKETMGQAGAALINVAKSVPEFALSPAGAAAIPIAETQLGKSLLQGLFAGLSAKGGAEQLGTASVTGDTQQAIEGALGLAAAPLLAKPGTRLPGETLREPVQPKETDAIPKRSTEAATVGEAPGDRGEVGARVPPPEKPPNAQAPQEPVKAPVQAEVKTKTLTPTIMAGDKEMVGKGHKEALDSAKEKLDKKEITSDEFLSAFENFNEDKQHLFKYGNELLTREQAWEKYKEIFGEEPKNPKEKGKLFSEDMTDEQKGFGEQKPVKQTASEYLREVKKIQEEASKRKPEFEIVEPSKDTKLGKNAAGEDLYQRKDGSVYRMRFDSPKTKPHGYPDFGGDLEQVEQTPKTPIESLSTEPFVKVMAPEGATALRGTDSKGRVSVQSLSNVNKGENPFKDSGITKIEAGTIGKDKKFKPMEGPISVGPGAASPGDVPQAPPIVQLTENIKQQGQISPKASVGERISDALKISEQWSKGKDSVTAAMGNAAAAKQGLLNSYFNLPKWTTFLDAVGKWIGADQKTALEVRNFTRAVNKSIPQKIRREAITNWIQADGDEAVLRQRAEASRPQFRRGYEEALKLNEAEKTLARNIGSYFDSMLQKGMDAGLLRSAVEDYVNQIWKREPAGRKLVADLFGFGNLNPSFKFARQRIFENYFEGESFGFVPKDKSIGYLLSVYDLAFNRALSARALIKTLHEGKASDGMPISMISEPSVKPITPVEGEPPSVILARPNIAPEGAVTRDGRPYMPIDHWALRGWRFATEGKGGAPVLMQGDMLVHPDHYTDLKNALQRSRLRDIPVLKQALNISALAKQTKLSLSIFHLDQEGLHGLFHRVNPANLVELDLNNAIQKGLVDHGLMVADPRAQELFAEGLSGGGLVGKIPGLGKLQTGFNDWLFRDYIPRLKMTMALDALERNRSYYAKELARGKVTDDQIQALTARESNAAFGEQNYKLMGRNPTLQDFLRLSLLAPDFLESRLRFVGQAAKPYGIEQVKALGLMGASLWVTSRLLNQYLDGDPHWDKPFSFVYKGKEYRLRTVLGDVYHLVTDPRSFIYNRLSPATRAGIEGITGRDDRGIKRSTWEQLKDLASWAIPIPFQRRKDQTALDSALGSVGISPKSLTARKQIYDIAVDWMKNNPDPRIKEKYEEREKEIFPESKYKALRTELQNGDLEKARDEYKKLLETHKPSDVLRAIRPWTVDPQTLVRRPTSAIRLLSAKENQAFLKSLTPDQRKIYDDAQKEREDEFRNFQKVLRMK